MPNLGASVVEAHRGLSAQGLLLRSFGTLSAIDRARGVVLAAPKHVPAEALSPDTLVELGLEGKLLLPGPQAPALATHLVLYKVFPEIGAVVQPHAHFATCWAQARKPIPCLGALHAAYFHGDIPVTDALTEVEVEGDFEYHTGKVIARCFREVDPLSCPAVLVAGHGPFAWGRTIEQAVEHAVMLEEVARLAWHTLALNPVAQPLEPYAQERHFYRKQGLGAGIK
jgi:L-ribulose-5-phosphate 4-epimerase